MTCNTAEPWLLASRSSDELPGEVRRHVPLCSHCKALFAQLRRVDEATTRLTPVANGSARSRLDAALARTPQEQPNTPLQTERNRRWPVRLVAGLAAAVLVAGGWVAGRVTSSKPTVQISSEQPKDQPKPQPKEQSPREQPRPVPPQSQPQPVPPDPQPQVAQLPVAPQPALAPGLVAKVARHAVSVAADPQPSSQLDALDRLAGEVRTDALERAVAGDLEQLPRSAALHERILKLGVARQLSRIPSQSRSVIAVRVADELNQSADEIAAVAGRLIPVAGDLLRPLIASCREIGTAIRESKPLPVSAEWPSPATPLESLVAQTIRMGDTTEPLARAEESAVLAATLAHAVTVLSVAGLNDDAYRVGEAMDGVLDHGVAANLDRVTMADSAGKFRKEVTEVRERASQATDVLERNLAKAPPAARAGLERALQAADPGRVKATGKGLGKPTGTGPPWKKGDGERPGKGVGTPPGWQKKP